MDEKKHIEREKAIEEFEIRSSLYDAEWGNKRFTLDDVVEILQSIPAADVVEVRHGGWIDYADKIDKLFHRHDLFCTKCHTRADYFIGGEGNWWCSYAPNYCPNCGAKMDGGEHDEAD